MLKLNSISPSRIKTFDMCKFKYWLTYCCPDVKLKSNWGASHGTLLHDILECYSSEKDTNWIARLYSGYGGTLKTLDKNKKEIALESPLIWAKQTDYANKKPWCDTCPHAINEFCGISQKPLNNLPGCPRDLFDKSISTLENVMLRYEQLWPKILRNKDNVLIGTEYALKIPVVGTDIPMIGYMDLVLEQDPETIHIIDYKAGKMTQDYAECRKDIQALMYSWASRREFIDDINHYGYQYKNIILTFDYFSDRPITLAFTAEEDNETEVFIKNKIIEIQNTDWIKRIVKSNDEFKQRGAWKCNALCDTVVCSQKWKGNFQTP